MKVLCTTDFSAVSINAVKWVILYLESIGGGEIEILHCLDVRSRGDMFINIEAMLREPAEKDMEKLIAKLKYNKEKVQISSKIVATNPKSYIPKRAKKISANLIAIGTTGLTNLKNITIGSVTEYIVKHTKLPVISIPTGSIFRNFNRIVLGADEKTLKENDSLKGVKQFIKKKNVKIFIAQVYNDDRNFAKLDGQLIDELDDYKLKVEAIPMNESISKSLNDYTDKVNAQILCIIHHKKKWFRRLFHHSILKEELFNQEIPILIIPD